MKKLLALFTLALFCSISAAAQTAPANLIEKMEIHFSMPGEPTAESVGFENPKSSWKLEYELMLADGFALEKMGRCERTKEDPRFNCPLDRSGKMHKKIKKIAIPVAKGQFTKRGPMSEADREVVIPVQLTPQVIDVFNKSVGVDTSNPAFILFIKTKAKTRAADRAKFKGKMKSEGIHPLKIYNADMTFNDYWNVTRIGVSLGLSRGNDGKIRGFHIFRF